MKESSEVLARKYRPTNFDELIGQETISQTLCLALDSNRLSHAYLFSGLRGSGKTSTARIFAKALICEKGINHKPCNSCQNCKLALENRHIDIIEMDGASSRKIDDIRDLIEQTKYKPASARFKIFIIDEVHMLTKEAFNALLKTLEEPPTYIKFILATTDPLKLPATILSRTQHFRFKRIATNKICDHLAHILNLEQISYEHNALEILARSGNGSLRDSLTLLDQAIIYSKNHVDVPTVTDMLGLVDPKFIQSLFSYIFAKDYKKIVELIQVLQEYEAEIVIDELIVYLKERMFANDALYSTLVLDRFFRVLSESKYLLSINAESSFVLSLVFFKMMEALRIKEIDQMIESMQKEIQISTISCNNDTQIKESESTEKEQPLAPEKNLFEQLVSNIKDRNYDLGRCFEDSISFISFNNNILTWRSCADEECKTTLSHAFSVIKQLVRELYGFETKIKHTPCVEQTTTSMIEDVEVGENTDNAIVNKEIDNSKIQDEVMVKKAVELFEAKKMTIQSKV